MNKQRVTYEKGVNFFKYLKNKNKTYESGDKQNFVIVPGEENEKYEFRNLINPYSLIP